MNGPPPLPPRPTPSDKPVPHLAAQANRDGAPAAPRRALYLASLAGSVAAIFARRWTYLLSHPARLNSWLRKKLGA